MSISSMLWDFLNLDLVSFIMGESRSELLLITTVTLFPPLTMSWSFLICSPWLLWYVQDPGKGPEPFSSLEIKTQEIITETEKKTKNRGNWGESWCVVHQRFDSFERSCAVNRRTQVSVGEKFSLIFKTFLAYNTTDKQLIEWIIFIFNSAEDSFCFCQNNSSL